MAKDAVGNDFSRAKKVRLKANGFKIQEAVGGSDLADIYRVKLQGHSSLSVTLNSPRGKASATLIKDFNGNGKGDAGETINLTASGKKSSRTLFHAGLEPGVYFLKVVPKPGSVVNYEMGLKAIAVSGLTDPFVVEVLRLTNEARVQNGLQPLTYNPTLGAVAQAHTQNMATMDFFDHVGLDGSTPQSRGTAAGYPGGVGENIAAGASTPAQVFSDWMGSSGHRENILYADYTEIGIGYYYLANDVGAFNYNYYWTQSFGLPWT